MILLLLVYFNLFWHTLSLFQVEGWQFGGFLYIVSGPLLILFATQVILPEFSDSAELKDFYFRVNQKFFLFLAALQLWIVGTDLVLGTGFQIVSTFNLIFCGLAVIMYFVQTEKVHASGVIATWILFLSVLGLRALGVIV